MKTKIVPILAIIFILPFFINSCEDSLFKEYKGYEPVYMKYEDLREAVQVDNEQDLVNPGKIYFKDDYIFIVEELKGIHVFDNTDPAFPQSVSFVTVPGVMDISISGFYLYADSYVDLVVLNVEQPEAIFEESRLKDVFPYYIPPHDPDYPNGIVDSEKGVVIDWDLTTIREKIDYNPIIYPIYFMEMDGSFARNSITPGVSGSGVGIGGSMSRFGLYNDILFVVDNNSLRIFDIANPEAPVKYSDFWAGWGIETMFIIEDKMFLGSQTGMFIYDLVIPYSPQQISFFQHGRSCDPVIVDGDLAYITLRTGTTCGGSTNSLDVVDISNLAVPELKMTYPLFNPHGLGKDGDILFICDGSQGLKIFDASNPMDILNNLLYHYGDIDAYDVIPLGNVLVMIGDDGLYQYDYSVLDNITLLSVIGTLE